MTKEEADNQKILGKAAKDNQLPKPKKVKEGTSEVGTTTPSGTFNTPIVQVDELNETPNPVEPNPVVPYPTSE